MLAGMSSPEHEPDDQSSHVGDTTGEADAPAEDPANSADWDLTEDDIAAAEVHPVTAERIRSWFEANGHNYLIRPDGQPAGIWNGSLFTFTVTQHVLQIRGQWNRTITIERRGEFMTLINNFHSRNPWPKCLLQVLDDGSMRFTAEIDTPISAGLSDQQLHRALRLGIGAGLSLYRQLDQQYPDPLMATGAA